MSEIYYVRDATLHRPDGEVVCKIGPKTGWFDWLGKRESFRFEGTAGNCSVICEGRKGSSGEMYYYWYAHRRIGGLLRRQYLGKGPLMLADLERANGVLAQLAMMIDGEEVSQR